MFGVFRSKRDLDRLIREPMDNEEEEFFDDNDSDVLDNEIGSRHNFQRYFIIIKEAPNGGPHVDYVFSINVYSYLLPNGEALLSQADQLFKKLLDDFHRCIAVNEIRPGLVRCDRQLRDYIAEFNFRFTKEQHLLLIKLYYNLITSDNIDPYFIMVSKHPPLLVFIKQFRCSVRLLLG